MTIIWIGQMDVWNQVIEARDQAIAHVRVHQLASSLELFQPKIWSVCENIANPLIVNHVAPAGPVQI